MKNEERDLHERLCAYVLGECESDAERAALEAQLAASPELRREKERIEATIGLVQHALGDASADVLPSTARAHLSAAARGEQDGSVLRPLPPSAGGGAESDGFPREGFAAHGAPASRRWWTRPSFQLAAAAGLLALLWVGSGGLEQPQIGPREETTVARLSDGYEKGSEHAGESKERGREERAQGVGRLSENEVEGRIESPTRRAGLKDELAAGRDDDGRLGESFGLGLEDRAKESAAAELAKAPEDRDASGLDDKGVRLNFTSEDEALASALEGLGYTDGSESTQSLGALNDVAAPFTARPPSGREAQGGGNHRGPSDGVPPAGSATATPPQPAEQSAPFAVPRAEWGKATSESAPVASAPPTPAPTPAASSAGSAGATGGNNVDLFWAQQDSSRTLSTASGWGFKGQSREATPEQGSPGKGGQVANQRVEDYLAQQVALAPQTGSEDFYLGRGEQPAVDQWVGRYAPPVPWEDQATFVLTQCRQFPGESPGAMFFRFYGDNPFQLTALDRLSTFAVDVDTASYALARRYLKDGHLPTKEQVRTEEFVNYFEPDVPAPVEETFAIQLESAPSVYGGAPDRSMLRVVLRGREVEKHERKPLALTFVVDVSGSMQQENRLELVKHALRLLVGELGARDAISLVAFSNEARLVLPPTSAGNRALIEAAIYGLSPAGGTNAEAGLLLGYEQAVLQLDAEANNRVVLLSDGVANIGQTDQQRLTDQVAGQRKRGIYLNTVGVGMENHNDALLEQLADKGDGLCNYVDSPDEARRALVDNFTGAFETIARDVKIQVEFDPAAVESWRQLGYENRSIADQDFRKDEVDAGEVGAGHQVEALYEIVRVPTVEPRSLATVRVRYKAPHGEKLEDALPEQAMEIERSIRTDQESGSYSGTTPGFRRAVLVAQFAELLRRSVHARGDSLDDLIARAKALEPELADPDFSELVALMAQSKELVLRTQQRDDPLLGAVDAIRQNRYLQAQLDVLQQERDDALVAEIEAKNRQLEERIRELLRERSEQQQAPSVR